MSADKNEQRFRVIGSANCRPDCVHPLTKLRNIQKQTDSMEKTSVDKRLDSMIKCYGKEHASERVRFHLHSAQHVYKMYKEQVESVTKEKRTVIDEMNECALTGLSDAIDTLELIYKYVKEQE